MATRTNTLALYIHYPFCSRKCGYCDFFSVENKDSTVESKMLKTSLRQFEHYIRENPETRIDTVFIGGGTPSLMEAETLYAFFEDFDRISSLKYCTEVTIEANPESLTKEKIEAYNQLPITRISIGLQSFQDEHLAKLGRCADRNKNLNILERISDGWKGRWSADLIHGIPGQTAEELLDDLKILNSFKPEHLSLYTLIPKHDSESLKSETEEVQDLSWQEAVEFLSESGFQRYEISNFCKAEAYSRHNLHYWNMHPFLGIGPTAASMIQKNGRPLRFKRMTGINRFLENPEGMAEVVQPGPLDFFLEYLMMGLRTAKGVRFSEIERIFGKKAVEMLLEISKRQKKFLKENDSCFAYTNKGLDLLNTLLVEIFLDAEQLPENALNMQWP